MEASLQPGETVLIHAGGSGVGTSAVQLCKSFRNPCFVTAGSEEKIQRCKELGASSGCVRTDEDFVGLVSEWTKSNGVDVILDPVGAAYFEKNLKVLATDGRLVVIGLMGGGDAEIALGRLMVKRQSVIGSTLRARPIAAKAQVMDELKKRVWPLIESGKIQPIIDRGSSNRKRRRSPQADCFKLDFRKSRAPSLSLVWQFRSLLAESLSLRPKRHCFFSLGVHNVWWCPLNKVLIVELCCNSC